MSRFTAILLALFVPVLALGLYGKVGSPNLPDQPLEARGKAPTNAAQKRAMLFDAGEKILQRDPDNGGVWEVMASLYLRNAMFGKAGKCLS